MDTDKMIKIPKEIVLNYSDLSIYLKTLQGNYTLYKNKNKILTIERILEDKIPDQIYVPSNDIQLSTGKLELEKYQISQIHQQLNENLMKNIDSHDVEKVNQALVEHMQFTLSDPRTGNLNEIPKTLELLVNQKELLHELGKLTHKDYTTSVHSVDVMALAMSYGIQKKLSIYEIQRLGVAGLLHDIGKKDIPNEILTAPRRLTSDEMDMIKKHPSYEFKILTKIGCDDDFILRAALEHHMKIDGSGYPKMGLKNISEIGQLIGIIDMYEALTAFRPYKDGFSRIRALNIIYSDVKNNKIDKKLFETFANSIVDR